MFRATSNMRQINAITNTENFLNDRSLKAYKDSKAWHNLFFKYVVLLINEDIFRSLFSDGNGAPNVSIRLMVGMFILREMFGWSYSEMFSNCLFNLQVRAALGLHNIDDSIPAESTFFLFLSNMINWEKEGKGNLMEQVFEELTESQIEEFEVSGKKVRMDSKIISSNIKWYSRYELVHETLRLAYISAKEQIDKILPTSDICILKEVLQIDSHHVTYHNTKSVIDSKFIRLGSIIYTIISNIPEPTTESIEILSKVFYQQYKVVDNKVTPLDKDDLKPNNIQSPHDVDCSYHKKNGKAVKGYTFNITETCSPDNLLNLITSVIVAPADTADNAHLKAAIENTEKIIKDNIETINADGAYHSVSNQEVCKDKKIDLILSKLGGQISEYDLVKDENDNLTVTHLPSNTIIPATKVKKQILGSPPTWKIINLQGKERKFEQHEVNTCELRKQIASRTEEEINLRNNVESTVHHFGYHCSDDKTRYRGLPKHRTMANTICIGINLKRICGFYKKLAELEKHLIIVMIIKVKYKLFLSLLLNLRNNIAKSFQKSHYLRFLGVRTQKIALEFNF